MPIIYLTLDQALEVHRKTVAVSGGGSVGCLDSGQLDSILNHMRNDDYYPSLAGKLTHLFFCTCKFHCFADGNKRIAITLCAQMLLLNGYLRSVGRFIRESENISYHVAAGNINQDLLGEWMIALLQGDENDEALKLKVLNAISKGIP